MRTPQEQEKRPNQLPLSRKTIQVLEDTKEQALSSNYTYANTEHLLLALMKEPTIKFLFSVLVLDQNKIPSAATFTHPMEKPATSIDEIGFTSQVIKITILANQEAKSYGQQEIRPIDLLTGIVSERKGKAAHILESLGLTEGNISDARNTYMLLNRF